MKTVRKIIFLIGVFAFIFLCAQFNGVRSSYSGATPTFMDAQAMAINSNTPQATGTATVTPPPTVDNAATIAVLQSELNNLIVINAGITAEHDAREFEKTQIAHDEYMKALEVELARIDATASYAPTAAHFTEVANTKEVSEKNFIIAMVTETERAPERDKEIVDIDLHKKWGWADYVARLLAGAGIVGIAVGMFKILRLPQKEKYTEPDETIIHYKESNGQGMGTTKILKFPLPPSVLTELAELAANGEKNFGYNKHEEGSETLTHDVLVKFRSFMLSVKDRDGDPLFAVEPKPGEFMLLNRGVKFMLLWFEEHRLPHGYEFEEEQE